MRFQNLRIGTRLGCVVLIAILGMVGIGLLTASEIRATLLQDRKIKTQHVVDVAYGVIANYAEKAKAGTMSEEEAKAAAMGC